MLQVNVLGRTLEYTWEVTDAAMASGAISGGLGATTEIFAPIQGFFHVASLAQLDLQVGMWKL